MSTPSTCERPSAERAAAGRRTRTATQAQALPSGPAASRQIIVSNRLPYRVDVDESGEVSMTRSAGGLATALGPLHERSGNLWIGWAEDAGERDAAVAVRMDAALAERACMPIHLEEDDAALYYEGFSNSTLWPLFHGFPQNTHFDQKAWEAYVRVNERFCDAVVAVARPGDVVWVQDYHLMLLPSLVRAAVPEAQVGFFLHIPFPDYETFRMLPWRAELVHGVLGADLIGFHAYDYVRHFLSSCRRIAGLENRTGTLTVEGRLVQADAFPLGIDYERFRHAALEPAAQVARSEFADGAGHGGCKIMLSVERLDYSKGVPERLRAYRAFLSRHPEWRGRVVLVLVTVPSRENVASYQALKAEIDELVGQVNGEFATLSWTPIDYYYRSLAFESLVALYAASDVMLVTPLRDGMNLVCKEYLACHDGGGGVLVLSEMAGAAYELQEALTVNPFDQEGLIRAIERALTMPEDEQRRRNAPMQQRLARYTSQKWSCEFLDALADVKSRQEAQRARLLGPSTAQRLLDAFAAARRRAILLRRSRAGAARPGPARPAVPPGIVRGQRRGGGVGTRQGHAGEVVGRRAGGAGGRTRRVAVRPLPRRVAAAGTPARRLEGRRAHRAHRLRGPHARILPGREGLFAGVALPGVQPRSCRAARDRDQGDAVRQPGRPGPCAHGRQQGRRGEAARCEQGAGGASVVRRPLLRLPAGRRRRPHRRGRVRNRARRRLDRPRGRRPHGGPLRPEEPL